MGTVDTSQIDAQLKKTKYISYATHIFVYSLVAIWFAMQTKVVVTDVKGHDSAANEEL